jgi:hypothetical protein
MQADTVKLLFTYTIALVVIVGGGLMLYLSRDDPTATLSLVVAGFIGSAITFVFGQESATRATRAAQSSAAGGAEAALATPTQAKP